ncbi:fumarylacetoacetate hydrolase [Streptomyces sp. SID5785]|uniref:fumarylacetoacetate hydrolase family protein n=1 Tax=Streptomyces sp. SID5785 TaxID=2690309 RepID=UPI00136183EE|nr:fumarylacetoacetate hydrolase family protein [Streptomyces sp. SID5785]MZD04014.1 fumarylacetoacetate hydrolase [Streptomyces sp. SID5785]
MTTRIVRFADPTGAVRTGVADDAARVRPFTGGPRIADLLRLPVRDLRARVEAAAAAPPVHDPLLLPPLDGRMEVWAAGVTYERSREARIAESTVQDVYAKVYDADRPELFLKSVAWRVVTDDEPIAVRADSALNVPEPELGLVVNSAGETAGYVVVDDVSSRSIEGENPLYLPQAKIYGGSTAVSSGIVPVWEIPDPTDLRIDLVVRRGAGTPYSGTVSTKAFHRPPSALVDHLRAAQPFPDGVILSTGTGIVPGLDFTLKPGDVVRIDIESVGTLTNPVAPDPSHLEWLVDADERPLVRAEHRGGR